MPKLDKKQYISDKISNLKSSLSERKRLSRDRRRAMEEQLKAKKQLERQYSRRTAIDPGNSAPKEEQRNEFRLWSARLREIQQEIRGLEREIEIKKKEDDLEIRILENEIQQYQAELRIYAKEDISNSLVKLASIADETKYLGNIELADRMKNIKVAQILVDDVPVSTAISRAAYDPKKKS